MTQVSEEIIDTVKAYRTDTSLVVVIPKSLRERLGYRKGTLFIVKTDDTGRIIYEPVGRTSK